MSHRVTRILAALVIVLCLANSVTALADKTRYREYPERAVARMYVKYNCRCERVGNGTMVGKDFNSNDGIRYGGYYTQEQLKEVVAYAASLGITVIPEIDLPGHMLGALAAYPELGCTGGPYEVWTRWGISDQVLCPGKEAMFTFLEDVFTELMEIFPSEYIHIGGDE